VRRIIIHLVVVRLERNVVLVIGIRVVAAVQPFTVLLGVVDPVVVVPVLIVGREWHLVMACRGS
jgi:hypothetical protein